jgi:polyphenol oxidase
MTEEKGVKGGGVLEPAGIVRVPAWERFEWLRHGFSRRGGGVSVAYGGGKSGGELNMGWTPEDSREAVAENRRRFVEELGAGAEMSLVTVRQVHGAVVRVVREEDSAREGTLETAEGRAVLEGDGLMTGVKGVLVGVQTADCVPVLVADVEKRVVAAIHAGWRGSVARIVEKGIAAMEAEFGSRREDLLAAVGPSIGACCYRVGDEVRGEFERAFGYAGELFRGPGGDLRLDLWEANRRQLLAAGIRAEKIAVLGECSGCAVDEAGRRRYFSHRVDMGCTGRMLSAVGVV